MKNSFSFIMTNGKYFQHISHKYAGAFGRYRYDELQKSFLQRKASVVLAHMTNTEIALQKTYYTHFRVFDFDFGLI